MPDATLGFDHVHLVAKDPQATANWYVDKLGGEITRSLEVKGAPQIYVSLGGFIIIVRGQRPAERAAQKPGLEWGIDHFGLRVKGAKVGDKIAVTWTDNKGDKRSDEVTVAAAT